MSWIWQGRQLQTAEKGGTTLSYTYDSEGIRTSKTVGSTTTKYLLNGTQILAQTTNGITTSFFYDQQGNRVAMADSSNHFYYYIYNLQGDVIALADASTGKLAVTYTYDAWGKLVELKDTTANSVGTLNPFRYRGYYYDTETSLYYLQTRYYDPDTGRFISADGQLNGSVLGYNMFTYCGNNPVNKSDPDGKLGQWISILSKGIQSGLKQLSHIIKQSVHNSVTRINKRVSATPPIEIPDIVKLEFSITSTSSVGEAEGTYVFTDTGSINASGVGVKYDNAGFEVSATAEGTVSVTAYTPLALHAGLSCGHDGFGLNLGVDSTDENGDAISYDIDIQTGWSGLLCVAIIPLVPEASLALA